MEKPSERVLTGVRKRQQIAKTDKNIFLWVAIASVIVSICIVALQFLVKEFMFNQKVINAKSETNQTLKDDVTAATQLKSNVDALISDSNLNSVKSQEADGESSNLTVVLDALPTDGQATSFANSLQSVILPPSGVSVKELSTTVDPSTDEVSTSSKDPSELPFSATISGSYSDVQKALTSMAKVIRPINPTDLNIRAVDSNLQVTVSGVTYYMPAKSVDVTTETLKP